MTWDVGQQARQQAPAGLSRIRRGLPIAATIVIVVVWGVVWLSLSSSERRYREHAEIATQNMVQLLEGQIAERVEQIDRSLQIVQRDSGRSVRDGLIEFLAAQDRLRFLGRIDAAGNPLAGAVGRLPPGDWPATLRAVTAPLTLLALPKPDDGPPLLLLARRGNGNAALVLATLPLGELDAAFEGLELGTRGSVALRDSDLQLLARRSAAGGTKVPLGDARVSPELASFIVQGRAAVSFSVVTPFDGIGRITSIRKVGELPLYAIVSLADTDTLLPWWREVRLYLVFAALISLAVLLAAWLALRSLRQQARFAAALAAGEQEFRAVANHTLSWESWLTPAGRVRWVSPVVERLTGYTPAECRAMAGYPEAMMVEEDRHQWLVLRPDAQGAVADSGKEFHIQCRARRRDGTIIWLDSHGHPVYDADGSFLGYRIGSRDVTRQRRHGEIERLHLSILKALAEDEALPAVLTLIEEAVEVLCAGASCCVLRFSANQGRLVAATPRRAATAGSALLLADCRHPCCACAGRGESVVEHDVGANPLCVAACLGGIVDTTLSQCHCEPLRDRDGVLLGVLVFRSAPMQPEDPMVRPLIEAAAHLTSIAIERRQSEEMLRRTIDDLRAANVQLSGVRQQLLLSEKQAAIGVLAAGAAHEINNPISFSITNLATLAEYIDDLLRIVDGYASAQANLPVDLRAHIAALCERADLAFIREDAGTLLAETRRGLERVADIVSSLRAFSGIDAPSDDRAASTDLEVVLDQLLAVAARSGGDDIEIVREYAGVPAARCRLAQIKQVLLTLYGNALDAARATADGERRIVFRTGADAALVWVELEDSGDGIPPDHLGRVFEPFFTTKPVGRGTGLGLAHAYGVVSAQGGQLSARNGDGGGAIFRLSLPRTS